MGTTQLTTAGVGAGDEVVVPSFGGADVAQAVRELGARPVFADIDPDTYCLDPVSAARAAGRRTAALVLVHLFGHRADMAALRAVGERHGVSVVEWEPMPRTDAIDAVRRRQYATSLSRRLRGVVAPLVPDGVEHAFTEYVVRVPGNGRPDRDALRRALRMRGVDCGVPVRVPAHRLPEYASAVRLPQAERAADECLSLPLSAAMTKKDLQRVVSACNGLGGLLRERAG
ncbi:DegT/DnrJ/EryC1/StrS family aminotransferase [Streptomyces qinglanensis]|uniref:DegT/DnrJ/EryC1/StrS aminotransferase family protein n=1 Tax=Streptomyces qinglanensis TaxID=943816 RepID=A0A1H9WQD8_9ACTN|nr:DegT/DnrJ/EryC1/StrS family aminotransferase [Streptomyces qinglanensis]SES36140.1 DegT/DnrJ/EryC1/StrS aminotransferase family protein [Streptomyces qinglanensis]